MGIVAACYRELDSRFLIATLPTRNGKAIRVFPAGRAGCRAELNGKHSVVCGAEHEIMERQPIATKVLPHNGANKLRSVDALEIVDINPPRCVCAQSKLHDVDSFKA